MRMGEKGTSKRMRKDLAVTYRRAATGGDEMRLGQRRRGPWTSGRRVAVTRWCCELVERLGLGAPRHRWMTRGGGRQRAEQPLVD
jgi:hypothetical protein